MGYGIQANTKSFNNQKHKDKVREARQKKLRPPSGCDLITIEQLDKIAARKTSQKKHILRKNR